MLVEPKKMVPPDGGWGWIAVIGVSIVNLCTRSIEPSFGLLFGDLLSDLGVGTTGAALIMSTLDALINFSGLFVGPLIRAFSYRKVSVVGAILCALGLLLTSPASSMTHILITYSIINGLGVGLTASATFVALNHYFVKKTGQAVGFSLAGTAFGMMLMPQAVRLLLEAYNFQGAIMILSAIALHSLAGSALLQPAEWHYIPEAKDEEEGCLKEMETIKEADEEQESPEAQNLLNGKTTPDLLVKPFEDALKQKTQGVRRNFSTMSFVGGRKASVISNISSISNMDFTGSSLQLHLQSTEQLQAAPSVPAIGDGLRMRRNMSYPAVQLNAHQKIIKDFQREPLQFDAKKKTTMWKKVVLFMDLDLLKDPIYLNLVFGLSIFYVAEQNFKMVTPFFFASIGYDKKDTAMFLSVQALTDILARLVLPPICDKLTVSKRTLFMGGIFLLGISRSVLAEATDYTFILCWLFVCGFVRGAALINFTITISEYSSLEKLPAAFGLHMVGKGIFVVAFGPLLGYIRDATGSYPLCLHSQTVLIMICCIAWNIEYLLQWWRARDEEKSDSTTT